MSNKPFKATINYITTMKRIALLIWRVSPRIFMALFGLALLNGPFPIASTLITSALLETLVRMLPHSKTPTSLPPDFIGLLTLMTGAVVLGHILQRLSTVVQNLYQMLVSNHINLLVAEKASAIDLAFFENPAFRNKMRIAAGEATYRPTMILGSLMNLTSTLTTLVSLGIVVLLWQAWIVVVIFLSSLVMLRVSVYFSVRRVALVGERSETERKKQYLQTLLTSDQAAKEIRLLGLRQFLLGK